MAPLLLTHGAPRALPTAAPQKLAAHYKDAVFLKFYGNANDDTKALFTDRLKCRSTPAFYFFRGGAVLESCTGANATRFETMLRSHCTPEELPGMMLYP